jgi:hypothetical protein
MCFTRGQWHHKTVASGHTTHDAPLATGIFACVPDRHPDAQESRQPRQIGVEERVSMVRGQRGVIIIESHRQYRQSIVGALHRFDVGGADRSAIPVMEGEAVGVIILVDAINTGPCLPLLASWGSPRGPEGRLTAGCDLVARPCDLVAGPLRESRSREGLFVSFWNCRRGAALVPPKEGWPAQHGARERRGVSLVEITTGVHRGPGDTWVAKQNPPN